MAFYRILLVLSHMTKFFRSLIKFQWWNRLIIFELEDPKSLWYEYMSYMIFMNMRVSSVDMYKLHYYSFTAESSVMQVGAVTATHFQKS